MSDYLTRCAAESLCRAGASESEVLDFADILLLQCNDARTLTPSDALCYLESWREERRMIAARTRELRAERINAGYIINATPVNSPVYINGATAW
jgi:hypothetical protein